MPSMRARSVRRGTATSMINTVRPIRRGKNAAPPPPMPIVEVPPPPSRGLTAAQVELIANAVGQVHGVARRFGVSHTTVRRIRNGQHPIQLRAFADATDLVTRVDGTP